MSTEVVVNLDLNTVIRNTNSSILGTYAGAPQINYQRTIQSSTVTKLYVADRTVTGSETLDLTTGLTDPYGNPQVFTSVLGVHIRNVGTGNLVIGGGATPVFGLDQQTVKAGRTWVSDSEWLVSMASKKILVTGTSSYNVIVYGA